MAEIRDPVLGDIFLEEQEVALLNTPEFQRLRRVKQLPFVDYVYPGATHTRFSHSLGVMELASRIGRRLGLEREDPETWQALRASALLEDLTELPFSSLFKEFFEVTWRNLEQKLREALTVQACANANESLTHLGKRIDTDRVLDVLLERRGQSVAASVIKSEVGANRLEYLLRDSHFCGVEYGRIDLRIVDQFQRRSEVLFLEKDALPLVNNIFTSLYQMKLSVYDHKVVRAALVMIGAEIETLIRRRRSVEDLLLAKGTPIGIHDDCTFMSKLKKVDPSIATKLELRQLPKAAYSLDAYSLKPGLARELDALRHSRKQIDQAILEHTRVPVRVDFVSMRPYPGTPIQVRLDDAMVSLAEVDLLRKWYERLPYEQWRLYVFCDAANRKKVREWCAATLGYFEIGDHEKPKRIPQILKDALEYMEQQKPSVLVVELRRKILEMPLYQRRTLIAVARLGSPTAREVAEVTERERPTSSLTLNELVKLGLVRKERVKREIHFKADNAAAAALGGLEMFGTNKV